MEKNMKCSKCEGEMEVGILIDKAGPNGQLMTDLEWGKWTEKKAFGGKVTVSRSVDNKKVITSYRCTKCGYLESYAK